MIESPVSTQCANAVIFGSGDSISDRQVVEPVLNEMMSKGLLGSCAFQSVSELPVSDDKRANLYIFLIDEQHLQSVGASQAAFIALRRAMAGDALVIPLIVSRVESYEQSSLAILPPLNTRNALTHSSGAGQSLCDSDVAEILSRVNSFLQKTQRVPNPAQQLMDRVASVSQIAESVDPLPCHMSAYDDFVEQLVARLQVMRMTNRKRNLNLFSEALRQVLDAEMVYCYFRSKKGDLHLYEADSNKCLHDCPANVVHSVLEEALTGYSNATASCSLRLQNFLPQLAPSGGSPLECMVIVNDRLPNCGVFVAARGGFTRFPLTEVLSTVINTLHDSLAWANFESFEKLKAKVYDVLKETYRYVSTDMYEDRRRIFRNQLSHLNVHFEPMFRFDRHSKEVEIFAYEALAREHLESSAAPVEIFNSASLWGMGFQSELDSTLLEITIAAYKEQINGFEPVTEGIKPLSLNVYPATLRSAAYRELLYEVLGRSAPLSGHNLIMEVSEKTVVSPEFQVEARKQLEEYRDVVRKLGQLTGVRFAIDDFGVGNASLSRLDSLKPHYVKIDRDILSFDTRMADTLIRYLIECQRAQGTSVILEGVDIHSKLSLDELVNDIGVSLIQGHSLSKAVQGFDPAWEAQICNRVKGDLGWAAPAIHADTQFESSIIH